MTIETDHPQITSFANHLLTDWYAAMDIFFPAVERKMRARGLSLAEAVAALNRGYGDEIGDAFEDYMDGES